MVIPTKFCKLVLPKEGYASGRVIQFLLDVVEPQFKEEFEHVVKSARIMIDIGAAADGWYSIKACKLNPYIHVYAIEPLKTEYMWLVINIHNNKCTERITPLKIALGDHEGSTLINDEEVKLTTLDNLIEKLSLTAVDIVKIDVKGAGYNIIGGHQNIEDI